MYSLKYRHTAILKQKLEIKIIYSNKICWKVKVRIKLDVGELIDNTI